MKQKAIEWLEKQIEKLDAPDFDLEAWKNSTEAVLIRIFGREESRVAQIRALRIDYSSWTLRDSNASYRPIESNKRKGREILETAIEEIAFFGSPGLRSLILSDYFDEHDVKMLLSKSDEKMTIIRKLRKEELQQLVLKLL